MNVSIKPFLILTSSPQMASLIYPFPRILAVHLKYAPANTSRKKKRNHELPRVYGSFGLCALHFFFFLVQILLITCPLRWADIYATGLPRKAQTHHRLIWQLFYSCQFLVTARARNESRSWCCSMLAPLQARLLIFSFIFKGFSLLLERLGDELAFRWHAPTLEGQSGNMLPATNSNHCCSWWREAYLTLRIDSVSNEIQAVVNMKNHPSQLKVRYVLNWWKYSSKISLKSECKKLLIHLCTHGIWSI